MAGPGVAKQSWALSALGLVGDDDGTADRLVPVIKAWPGEGGHRRAVAGLDVLAAINTDHALTRLNEIAQRVQFKALKEYAGKEIAQTAAARGMSGEQLKPFIVDEAQTQRKDLPSPNSHDDAEAAVTARAQFTALKKEARAVAADQIRRLEAALVDQRSWTGAEFSRLPLRHPLLRHAVRRLVRVSEIDGVRTGFRVAEDLSLADDAWYAVISLDNGIPVGYVTRTGPPSKPSAASTSPAASSTTTADTKTAACDSRTSTLSRPQSSSGS